MGLSSDHRIFFVSSFLLAKLTPNREQQTFIVCKECCSSSDHHEYILFGESNPNLLICILKYAWVMDMLDEVSVLFFFEHIAPNCFNIKERLIIKLQFPSFCLFESLILLSSFFCAKMVWKHIPNQLMMTP